MGCCTCVQKDQSVRITSCSNKSIEHGPGCIVFAPCSNYEVIEKYNLTAEEYLKIIHLNPLEDGDIIEHISGPCIFIVDDGYAIVEGPFKKIELDASQYVVMNDPKTGERRVVEGPKMYMPKPYEISGKIEKKISLLNNQYVKVTDSITGHIKIIPGPTIYTPSAYEYFNEISTKVEISITQYIICTDGKTGEKTVVEGPNLYVPKEFEQVSSVINKINLKNNEYCHIKDSKSGLVSLIEGPKVFALTPFENLVIQQELLPLSFNQYVFIKDIITGVIKIIKGPTKVILSPVESYIKDNDSKIVRDALTSDANCAIHIKDISSGVEKLITEPMLFFPESPNILILGVRNLIKLAPYERMVIIDRDSNLIFKSGLENPGFFLPPFCNILKQKWTFGSNHEKREISIFDTRFHDMDFKFSVRTNDNVEILMQVNIYWTIKDFETMIKSTDDPPQDLCNQIRSQILNIASKMSTKELMEFSSIDLVRTVTDEDTEFCQSRGVSIVRINITEKKCGDPEVDKTYRLVIEEKINRVKILEAQKGKNDRNLSEIEGQIMFEAENYKLLEKKMANIQMENETHGKAEGERIHMFFEGLGKTLTSDEKLKIFMELQRTERIKMVTSKVDNLYVTPNDVDFSLHRIENDNNNKNNNVSLNLNTKDKK
jgi:regulator of protease activity HflC (stomatin/prohibitin superfamily)